ncbi:hypothetical protein ILUMI_07204 [Ignelater luminosus]|uniref:Integrase catalytic domain-containing protein n=1 Tax=Ignelater luminosus TaxID=2038154 RepID=A0A8K0D982_IGNLU|nr:hypothetical protein ILUMI_07204 [Ignelater luminosus]
MALHEPEASRTTMIHASGVYGLLPDQRNFKILRDICDPLLPKEKTYSQLCELLTQRFIKPEATFKSDKSKHGVHPAKQASRHQALEMSNKLCYACGKGNHKFVTCKYRSYACKLYKQLGALTAVCNKKNNQQANNYLDVDKKQSSVSNNNDLIFNMHTINTLNLSKDDIAKPILCYIFVNDIPLEMEVDTGVGISAISYDTSNIQLKCYGGNIIEPVGEIQVAIRYNNNYIDRYKISNKGLRKDESKVEAIVNTPEPRDVCQLRAFLGLVTYCDKFVYNLANQLKPLYRLSEKNSVYIILVHFNPQLPIKLNYNASNFEIAAVLSHVYPYGEEKPIAFGSLVLTSPERNYSILHKEAMAVYFETVKCYQYLMGHQFILACDHKPLLALFDKHKGIPHMAAGLASLDRDIKDYVRSCRICASLRPEPPKTKLIPWKQRNYPLGTVHLNFLGPINGKMYLLLTDSYKTFSRFGLSNNIVTDDGTQFTAYEFAEFCQINGIRHVTSPPYHPATNSAAENAVKSFKQGFYKLAKDPRPRTKAAKQQIRNLRGNRDIQFTEKEQVHIRNYRSNDKWVPGEIEEVLGKRIYLCRASEGGQLWKRHNQSVVTT